MPTNGVVTLPPISVSAVSALPPFGVAEIRKRTYALQEVMRGVMKDGTHYGTIPGTPKPSLWKTLSRPLTLKLALPNLAIGFGAATLIPYLNVFFSERYHMSDSALGMLFGVGSLATGLGCIIGPRLVGNLGGKVRTITLGQAVSLVFLLIMGFSPWPWLAVVGFIVRGALMNMVSPLFDAFALEQSHETEHGAVTSIRNLAWNVGWTVGPYASGLVQQRWGFAPLFINTAVMYGIGITLTWIFFRPKSAAAPAVAAV